MSIIVCGPPRQIPAYRHVGWCPLCERRRRLVTRFDGVYYGTTTYCLACGGQEQEGDWRPDSGRYTQQNREYRRGLWASGVDGKTWRARVSQFKRAYWEGA